MAAAAAEIEGLEFLLDPVGRFPLKDYGGDSEGALEFLRAGVCRSVAEQDPSMEDDGVGEANSAMGAVRSRDDITDGGEVDSKRQRRLLPAGVLGNVPEELLACVAEPDEVGEYNWGEYLLEQIKITAEKFQQDLEDGAPFYLLGGCNLMLAIWYLDWIDFGSQSQDQALLPRIGAYECTMQRR